MIHPARILHPRSVGVKIRFASRLDSNRGCHIGAPGQCRSSAKARVFAARPAATKTDRIMAGQNHNVVCTESCVDDSVLPRFCGSPAFAKSAKVFLATCERIGILQSGAAMRQPRTFSRQKKLTENGLKCVIGRAIRLLAALSMVWAESPKPVQEFVSLGPRRFAPDEWSHYLRITPPPAAPPDTQSPSPSPSSAVRRPSFCRAPAGTS